MESSHATSSQERVQAVLRELRSGAGLGLEEFAEWVGDAGFPVSAAAARRYEEGGTKKVPLAYVEAVCRALEVSPALFFAPDLGGSPSSPDEAERQLAQIKAILLESPSQRKDSFEAPLGRTTPGPRHEPESLRRRFLTAVAEYSDLEVERICGLNHETVRQYRQDQWPSRGPNSATEGKIQRFLDLHERRRTVAATDEGELPALIEGLIAFAEEWANDEEFCERYPNHGWISITEDAIRQLRQLKLVRYDEEIAWLAYKRAVGYTPEHADDVGLADLGMTIDPFVPRATQNTGEEVKLKIT